MLEISEDFHVTPHDAKDWIKCIVDAKKGALN